MRHKIFLLRHGLITEYDPKRDVSIATLAYEYPQGYEVAEHSHGSHQLLYARQGLMRVSSGRSLWFIPPQSAIWIPARTAHSLRMQGVVSMRTLYMRNGLVTTMPPACAVLQVRPLLRELILEAVRIGALRIRNRLHCALRDLLVAQIVSASAMPTDIVLPGDGRAQAVAQRIIEDPARQVTLAKLCAEAGASLRTVERAFRRDVGIDPESWRRRVRLIRAVELLVTGRPVKEAAFAVGYRQPSAFVCTFRKTFGATPKAWNAKLGGPGPD